jgi:hypothetical protein
MGTGGSRYGAGRPSWRRKCEHLFSLDVRYMQRRGYLRPASFNWRWTCNGEPSGSVSITVEPERLTLNYQWTPNNSDPVSRSAAFRLSHTNCYLGGVRPWLTCKWCYRRCAIIYGVSGDGYFACRRCLKLGYSSESEDMTGRLWRKQRKLEARLGDNYQKPKWMRMCTYDRIWTKINEVEETKDRAFYVGALALLRRGRMMMEDRD